MNKEKIKSLRLFLARFALLDKRTQKHYIQYASLADIWADLMHDIQDYDIIFEKLVE